MSHGRNRYAVDIKSRTGWGYALSLHFVSVLSYEVVSDAVDEAGDAPTEAQLEDIQTKLREAARVKVAAQRADASHARQAPTSQKHEV